MSVVVIFLSITLACLNLDEEPEEVDISDKIGDWS